MTGGWKHSLNRNLVYHLLGEWPFEGQLGLNESYLILVNFFVKVATIVTKKLLLKEIILNVIMRLAKALK